MKIRRLKAMCLAVTAVLGLAAVWTASASALGEEFHSVVEPTVLTGTNYEIDAFGKETVFEGEHKFTTAGLTVQCSTSTVAGTWSVLTPETMTLHPTYKNCKSPALGNVTIDTTGCNLIYWSEVLGTSDAKIEVECEAGQLIKVTAPGCTLKVGNQGSLGATYTNGKVNEKGDITVKTTWNVGFTKEGACFGITETKAKYEGAWTVGGYKDICAPGECPFVPAGGTDKDAYTEGPAVEIWWE